MKISKTKLHQIIKEEVASLVEAPNLGPYGTEPLSATKTKFQRRPGPKQRRADQDG